MKKKWEKIHLKIKLTKKKFLKNDFINIKADRTLSSVVKQVMKKKNKKKLKKNEKNKSNMKKVR